MYLQNKNIYHRLFLTDRPTKTILFQTKNPLSTQQKIPVVKTETARHQLQNIILLKFPEDFKFPLVFLLGNHQSWKFFIIFFPLSHFSSSHANIFSSLSCKARWIKKESLKVKLRMMRKGKLHHRHKNED